MQSQLPVKRKLGIITATSLVVANMIGTGIFTTTGIMANILPDKFIILLCWLLGGLVALSGALSYSELATRMPEEGGEYVYLKKLYHPVAGFLTGWTTFFVGFSAPIAGGAISFAAYFMAATGVESLFLPVNKDIAQKIIAVCVILLFTVIHSFGIKKGSFVQNILTALKILIILGLSITGIYLGSGTLQSFTEITTRSVKASDFGTVMMLVMFAYSGWNASSYIAGEIVNPKKTIPVSLILGTLIVTSLYVIFNFFILKEVNTNQVKNTITIVGNVSTQIYGNQIGSILGLLVSISLLSSISAFIIIGPRIYYAMSLDRMFFSFASRIHPKYEVPRYSIILQGMLASIMVMIGTFEQLLIYIGFALNIFPWLAIFGLFIARKRKIGEDLAVKTWGYPFVPIFYLISSLLIMITAFLNRPFEAIVSILTVLAGIPVYYLFIKKNFNYRITKQIEKYNPVHNNFIYETSNFKISWLSG